MDPSTLKEYGLIGSFDSICCTRGESVAVVYTAEQTAVSYNLPQNEADSVTSKKDLGREVDSDDECLSPENSSLLSFDPDDLDGTTYMEIQLASQQLAQQLYFRFGVRKYDRVLLVCADNLEAEIVAMLACMRIGAPFVPIDQVWLSPGCTTLNDIILDSEATAAVVVAMDDADPVVVRLGECGHYKCALINQMGNLSEYDASVSFSCSSSAALEHSSTTEKSVAEPAPPLYVLYTSGSTGKPKGVMGSHGGLLNRLSWQLSSPVYCWQYGEVASRRTPLIFVDAIAETFAALLAGVPIVALSREAMRTGGLYAIAATANKAGVTRITLLPSQLYSAVSQTHTELSESADHCQSLSTLWPRLKYVFVSGEECTLALVKLFHETLPDKILINLYGSTEVAGDVAAADLCSPNSNIALASSCDGSDACKTHCVSIGQFIPGNEYLIVDIERNPVNGLFDLAPKGQVGQLIVYGSQLAHGYNNLPLETQARFLERSAFSPHILSSVLPSALPLQDLKKGADYANEKEYFYLTGDLVFEGPGGRPFAAMPTEQDVLSPTSASPSLEEPASYQTLFWVGRVDRQVKIRGIRVELENMERLIAANLKISSDYVSVLTHRSDKTNNIIAVLFVERHALADIECSSGAGVTATLSDLAGTGSFPAVMVPAETLILQQLPRTATGKVDRKALLDHLNFGDPDRRSNLRESAAMPAVDTNSQSVTISKILAIYGSVLPSLSKVLRISSMRMNSSDSRERSDSTTINSSFFELGGDSLTAVEVLRQLRQQFSFCLGPFTFDMLHMNICSLASHLDASFVQTTSSVPSQSTAPTISHEYSRIENLQQSKKRKQKEDLINDREDLVASNPISDGFIVSWIGKCNVGIDSGLPAHTTKVHMHGTEFSNMTLEETSTTRMRKCVDSSPVIAIFRKSSAKCCLHSKDSTEDNISDGVKAHQDTIPVAFMGSHGGDFKAVELQTGRILWCTELGEHIEGAAICAVIQSSTSSASSSTSSCSAKSIIFVCTYAGNDVDGFSSSRRVVYSTGGSGNDAAHTTAILSRKLGALWALDARTGDILWCAETEGELKGSATYQVLSQLVFAGSYDGYLYCYNAITGLLISKINCGGALYACPQIIRWAGTDTDSVLVVTTNGFICSVSCPATSSLSKSHKEDTIVAMNLQWSYNVTEGSVFTTPYVDVTHGFIIAGTTTGRLIHLKVHATTSAYVHWNILLSEGAIFASPQVFLSGDCAGDTKLTNRTIIVGSHDGQLRGISLEDGSIRWVCNMGVVIFGSPFLFSIRNNSGEVLEACAITTTGGDIIIVSSVNGCVLARRRLHAEIYSSPVVNEHGYLVFGSRGDRIHCYKLLHSETNNCTHKSK